jgi:hypothetical protein
MTINEYKIDHKDSFSDSIDVLYNELVKAGCEINFESQPSNESWSVNAHNSNKFTVFDPEKEPNPNGLAHELLHIELYRKGFIIEAEIQAVYNGGNSLFGFLFGQSFIPPISNTLAHLKMINRFSDLELDTCLFLQNTPDQHFQANIRPDLECMLILHNSNAANKCLEAIKFIVYCGTAKLYELYPRTDLTKLILDFLNKINKELANKLESLYDEWIKSPSNNNLNFFSKLDQTLKEVGIPNASKCEGENNLDSILCSNSSKMPVDFF